MKKEQVFSYLIIIAVAAIFFSFISGMDYMGFTVKETNKCLITKNQFETFRQNADCANEETSERLIEICKKGTTIFQYEYLKGNYKSWEIREGNEITRYKYDLDTKECKG